MPSLSNELCVLPVPEAPPEPPPTGVSVQPGAGPAAGFAALEQSVLRLRGHAIADRAARGVEETMFVLSGHGVLRHDGRRYPLGPESGLYLPPEQSYVLEAGADGLELVSVRIPDPEPGGRTAATTQLGDQAVRDATTERQFRIVADPSTGLRSATHFVGYIPATRAPDHFHLYDEVIYVLEGEGMFHAQGTSRPIGQGTCIGLPARLVHCLENTGGSVMRVLGVFRPAGSPADAYYPDGTPAYTGVAPLNEIPT
jgi:mannose-6-phosphate isomerase-like protein (cupin superfamily)